MIFIIALVFTFITNIRAMAVVCRLYLGVQQTTHTHTHDTGSGDASQNKSGDVTSSQSIQSCIGK